MNNKRPCLFGLATLLVGFGIITSSTHAQVIPDGTLSTSVTSSDNQNFVIENGDRNGNNLFHSFSEFSIPTDGSARFNNAADIETIFSRVTGTNISNIDGLMQTNGNASLFLLNPNGILFGSNARLDIGGSFFGTTADTLLFDEGGVFSTTNARRSSLLNVNIPTGLQWNQADPNPITLQNTTLELPAGATLALLGGDLSFEGSSLTVNGGQAILSSLGTAGTVQLDGEQSVSFPDGLARGDITLTDTSFISAEAGSINVIGNTLSLSDGATLGTVTNSPNMAGNILLNVEDTIELTEANISSTTFGPGDTGHILIETGQLSMVGSEIVLKTFASGNAGNIRIRADESVELNTILETVNRSAIANEVAEGASGAGGEITIETSILKIFDGSALQLVSSGTGNVGDINITASESVDFVGGFLTGSGFLLSGILVFDSPDNRTANGDVTITTGQLRVLDGAQITTSPRGTGNGGNITIVARDSIDITGGVRFDDGRLGSSLSAGPQLVGSSGNGGNIILRTGQLRVHDGGAVRTFSFEPGDGGDIIVDATSVNVIDARISAEAFGEGNAGNVDITATQNVSVVGSSRISVSALEGSNTGELTISAGSILLDKGGRLSAETSGGDQGNIRLAVNDALLLRRGGSITTNATGTSTGGNITITSPFIVAVPAENSDIVANAVAGNGGNIQIAAAGIFGIEFRPQITTWSDITASSQFGVAGIVQIQTPDLDPSQGIVELPSSLTDPSTQITTGCAAMAEHSFTVTGRGGLPAAPDTHNISATWTDWRPLETEERTASVSIAVSQASLREATAMVTDISGQVQLVASTAEISNAYRGVNNVGCGSRGDA